MSIRYVDSHTEGEPTRVMWEGVPGLSSSSVSESVRQLKEHHDDLRTALIQEPRGYAAMVAALVGPPVSSDALAQVVFCNNAGYLGMCVHGTIGLAVTLRHLGRIEPGVHRLDTPVGTVSFELHQNHRVTVQNVPSYRFQTKVAVDTKDHGAFVGDIAWGGNWFYLVQDYASPIHPSRIPEMTALTKDILASLEAQSIFGKNQAKIDHVELFGKPSSGKFDSRNYVLCPGGEYDRSPCGTGTSAKLACLFADEALKQGEVWNQESILGTSFRGWVEPAGDQVIPFVQGRAWITAEGTLVQTPDDPFRHGVTF